MPAGRLVIDEKPTRARSHSPCELDCRDDGGNSQHPSPNLEGSVQYHQVSSFPNLSLARQEGSVMDCTLGYRAILNSLVNRYQSGGEIVALTGALSQCSHLWAEALVDATAKTSGTGVNALQNIQDISEAVPDDQLRALNKTLLECALLQGIAANMLHSLLMTTPSSANWKSNAEASTEPVTVGSLLSQLQPGGDLRLENSTTTTGNLTNTNSNNTTNNNVMNTGEMSSSSYSAAPAAAVSGTSNGPVVVTTNNHVATEGLHIPQLDLDALLGPPATEEKYEVWRRAARRAVQRKGVPSMGHRIRSVSDFDRSTLREPLSEAVDLRPAWMRSAALSSVLSKNLAAVLTVDPFAYVEWNIVGFQRVVAEKLHDRIVSPEIRFRPFARIDSTLQPHSLRLMVTINRPSSGCDSPRLGIEFTVAEPIEVSYRIVSSNHVSEPRWHAFNEKPWAGLTANETQPLPKPAPIMLTVGVLIESIRRPRLNSVNSNFSRKNPSSNNVRRKGGSGADFAHNVGGRRGTGSDAASSRTPTRVRSQSDWPTTGTTSTSGRGGGGATTEELTSSETPRALPSACLPSLSNLAAPYGAAEQSVKDLLSGWARAVPVEAAERLKYSHIPLPMQKSLSRMQLDQSSLMCEDPQRRQLISRIWTSDSP